MAAVSIASVAVCTQRRGYSSEQGLRSKSLEFQGDAGWGVAQSDGPWVLIQVQPGQWETRLRKAH